jgi:alkylated DNA repair protein (DNA oxidative demethylase)
MSDSMPRLPGIVEAPEGFAYEPAFLSEDEEQAVVAAVERLEFAEVRMRGQVAKRTVLHFGYRYDYEAWRLVPAEPLPHSLAWLRERAGALADVEPDLFVETLVTRYPSGAGIGWHRDAPMFGPKVVGVSLVSSCTMRFQRRTGTSRTTYAVELAPRSAYVLAGPARSVWQHSIPPTKGLRYSVTFRTARSTARVAAGT